MARTCLTESIKFHWKLAKFMVGWLCWGLTSQSTIFQSYWDGAIASWVINQYFRGVKCLAQGHNTAAVGLEPRTSRSGVRHSTTEPPRSPQNLCTQRFTCAGHFPTFGFDSQLVWRTNVISKTLLKTVPCHLVWIYNGMTFSNFRNICCNEKSLTCL